MRTGGAGARGAVGVHEREHGVLVLGDRVAVRRPAAEPRHRLGAAQRLRDRRAPVARLGEHVRGHGERAAAQAGDRRRVLLEGDRGELGVVELADAGRRHAQREVAAERARLEHEVAGAARRAEAGDLGERADRRRDGEPAALGHRRRVGAHRDRHGNDGQQPVGERGDGDRDRLLATGARQPELALGARELVVQQRAQLGTALARRGGSAGLGKRGGEQAHAHERTGLA